MQLAVIGTGYVGLVSGACFAEKGHTVVCVDINTKKIEMLKIGRMPIYEPGLEEIVRKNVTSKKLSFSTNLDKAVSKASVVFIAVDTPSKPNGQADLSRVELAAKSIAESIKHYALIANISTVPVGTGKYIRRIVSKYISEGASFDIVSNPEFLREGSAVKDRLNPSRIVIGAETERAINILKEVYSGYDAPLVITNTTTSEMIKYASNAFLATKISFINEIAHLCEEVDADVKQVALGMGYDKRIGFDFLDAGLGYGGSCFPKDARALSQIAFENGYNFTLLKAVIDVNHMQRVRVVQKVQKALNNIEGKTIGILGLAFKPNTDDVREAASIDIINYLQSAGVKIKAYDPIAMDKMRDLVSNVSYCETPYDACRDCSAVIFVTEWDEFKNLDLERIKQSMITPVVIDGRNIFDPKQMHDLGFTYSGFGR